MTFNLTWNDGSTTVFTDLPAKVQEIYGVVGHRAMQTTAKNKANSDAKKAIVAGTDRKSSDVGTPELKAWRESDEHSAQYEAWANAYMDEFKAASLAGVIEMPGVSVESLTQDETDRRSAAKKTILEVYKAHGVKYEWPRAEKGSGDEGQLAAEQAREAVYEDFFSRLANGGDFVKIFNRHLNAIKRGRTAIKSDAPVVKGGLDLLGGNGSSPSAVAAQ
jgi:hypothetical protein